MYKQIAEYINLTQEIINDQESQIKGLQKTASVEPTSLLNSVDVLETADILKEAGFNTQSKNLVSDVERDPQALLSCINKLAGHVIRMDSREEPNVFGETADNLLGSEDVDADAQFDSKMTHLN